MKKAGAHHVLIGLETKAINRFDQVMTLVF